MLSFFVKRPIATLVSLASAVLLGIVSLVLRPVSLLPNQPLPQVSISVPYPKHTPEEIEQFVLRPIRQELIQMPSVIDLSSEAIYGYGEIEIEVAHEVDIQSVFFQINDIVDRLQYVFPPGLERPIVNQTTFSQLPIMRLQVAPKVGEFDRSFYQLSTRRLKRQLEQLPGVGTVDISGVRSIEVAIELDFRRLERYQLRPQKVIDKLIEATNLSGALQVSSGQYLLQLDVGSELNSLSQLQNVRVSSINGLPIFLKDLAKVSFQFEEPYGLHLYQGKLGVVFAVFGAKKEGKTGLEVELSSLIDEWRELYPNLQFAITQDQLSFLDVSIRGLYQTLIFGSVFAILVLFVFFGRLGKPLILGITIPVCIIISFCFYHVLGLSINLLSISGLALGVGLLIDNGIIILERINQFREDGRERVEAATKGANAVITPLISSTLTTISVFLPLIFLSGKAGDLFYEQAISIAIVLLVSLFVSYLLIPTLYALVPVDRGTKGLADKLLIRGFNGAYHILVRFPWILRFGFPLVVLIGVIISLNIPNRVFPPLTKNDAELEIIWSNNLKVSSQAEDLRDIMGSIDSLVEYWEADIGHSQFLITDGPKSPFEAQVYVKFRDESSRLVFSQAIERKFDGLNASIQFNDANNPFNTVFNNDDPWLEIRLRDSDVAQDTVLQKIMLLSSQVNSEIRTKGVNGFGVINIKFKDGVLNRYGLQRSEVVDALRIALGNPIVGNIEQSGETIGISVYPGEDFYQLLDKPIVFSKDSLIIAPRDLLTLHYDTKVSEILADRIDNYISLDIASNGVSQAFIQNVQQEMKVLGSVYSMEGRYFESKELFSSLVFILLISVVLLYFILSAQFESLILPVLILAMIPFGIIGSVVAIWISNQSYNVMSGIGVIVVTGIIINDAILKVDAANERLKKVNIAVALGPRYLNDLMYKASLSRLKPIVMTSLTTILALLPTLFGTGIGAELQSPLVVSVIGGLILGTLASLFLLPGLYVQLILILRKRKLSK